MVIFAFIIASSERGRGGAGFRGGFFRLFGVAELPDCSSCRDEEGGGASQNGEGSGGRELARKIRRLRIPPEFDGVRGMRRSETGTLTEASVDNTVSVRKSISV